jgi:Rrf2 family transcriptional regulator, nitric oxide-sensitive transcriptional repressor
MQLTQFTDYALRTLLYLGTHPLAIVPASTISTAYDISLDHTVKVAKRLTQLGYVNAQRGKGGGLRLARSPNAICLGTVIRETESQLDLLECFDAKTNTCPLIPACHLKHALHRARDAFFAVLDEYTLADLLRNAPELIQLLPPGPR